MPIVWIERQRLEQQRVVGGQLVEAGEPASARATGARDEQREAARERAALEACKAPGSVIGRERVARRSGRRQGAPRT